MYINFLAFSFIHHNHQPSKSVSDSCSFRASIISLRTCLIEWLMNNSVLYDPVTRALEGVAIHAWHTRSREYASPRSFIKITLFSEPARVYYEIRKPRNRDPCLNHWHRMKKAMPIGVDEEFWSRIVVKASHLRGKKFIRGEKRFRGRIFIPTWIEFLGESRIYLPWFSYFIRWILGNWEINWMDDEKCGEK